MRSPRKQRKVRISTLLEPEEAELFEAWRQQHFIGSGSVSYALRGLISIYLGVKGWPPNAPGFNSAWTKTLGWELLNPRTHNQQIEKYENKINRSPNTGTYWVVCDSNGDDYDFVSWPLISRELGERKLYDLRGRYPNCFLAEMTILKESQRIGSKPAEVQAGHSQQPMLKLV